MVHNMKNLRNTIVMINRLKLKSLNPSNHVLLQSSQVVFFINTIVVWAMPGNLQKKEKKKKPSQVVILRIVNRQQRT